MQNVLKGYALDMDLHQFTTSSSSRGSSSEPSAMQVLVKQEPVTPPRFGTGDLCINLLSESPSPNDQRVQIGMAGLPSNPIGVVDANLPDPSLRGSLESGFEDEIMKES